MAKRVMDQTEYHETFQNVTTCINEDQKVLESLRFRDQDVCLKGGAVLAFCALVIACVLVVMSAAQDSNIFVAKHTPTYWLLLAAFWLSLLGSLAAFGCILRRKEDYDANPQQANVDYFYIIKAKNRFLDASIALSISSVLALVASTSLAML